jgi:hypothetical protein
MNATRLGIGCTLALVIGIAQRPAFGCGSYLDGFVAAAVSEDPVQASLASKRLRDAGPAGLNALLAVHAATLKSPPTDLKDPAWQRLCAALDAVGAQRDCYASRLYWYTDIEQAKAAANASGKPILSLRLLGKLTDEYSCANSRFFRTVLYANEAVSQALRERFVLHWESVRPVPRVTIDFGDGRKLERTITGNSIHYILDAEGRPVDALPGLYGPKAFLEGLERAREAGESVAKLSTVERDVFLRGYHREALKRLGTAWSRDVAEAGVTRPEGGWPNLPPELAWHRLLGRDVLGLTLIEPIEREARHASARAGAGAERAAELAATKRQVEQPILVATASHPLRRGRENEADDEAWRRIAAVHGDDARLDAASVELVGSHYPTAADAAPRAMAKTVVENPLLRMVRNFETSIALDTVRNEYLLHRQIHEWFMDGAVTGDASALNERVYAELFLTPSSDPWLGLVPADTYTGLTDGGLPCTRP